MDNPTAEQRIPSQLREWADSNLRNRRYGPGLLRIAADLIESQIERLGRVTEPPSMNREPPHCSTCECGMTAEAKAIARGAAPPPASPNEGPVVNGLVQLPDGSGVLPAFSNQWKCSQCGRDPQDVKYNGCGYSLPCGRVSAVETPVPLSKTDRRERELDAAARTGDVAHYTSVVQSMIDEDDRDAQSEGDRRA